MTPHRMPCVCSHGRLSHEGGTGACKACALLVSANVPGWVRCEAFRLKESA